MKTPCTRMKTRLNVLAFLIYCLIAASASTNRAYAQSQWPPVDFPSRIGNTSGKIDSRVLSKAGPQFASGFVLSSISATVFARATRGVIEYQLDPRAAATLTITIKGKKESFIYQLRPTGAEIKQEVFQLPDAFGKKPVVAELSVKAENLDPASKSSPGFVLYALALGEKAVGSLKIDQLSFNPPHVRANEKISVTYSFHSLADFDRAAVEFWLIGKTRKGEPENRLVNTQKISGGVRRGETKEDTWDGKNQKGKVSQGRHLLFVRAWFPAKSGGDWSWVSDPARQRVTIE